MTDLVIENLRLKELLLVVNMNRPFFEEFLSFLNKHSYKDIHEFVSEPEESRLSNLLKLYFESTFTACLYDGIGRAYDQSKSKWYFITWLLRDAPQQRLQPILASLETGSTTEKRIWLIIKILNFVVPLMPKKEQWQ